MKIKESRITKIIVLLLLITVITSVGDVFINKVLAETFKIQRKLSPVSGEGGLITEFWIEEANSGKQIDLSNELVIGKNSDYVFNVSLSSRYMDGLATWFFGDMGCNFDTGANIEYLPELKLNNIVLTPVSVGLDSDSLNYILRYKLDSTKNNNFGQNKIQTITFDTEWVSNGSFGYMAFYDLDTEEVSENDDLIYKTRCDFGDNGDCDITIDFKAPTATLDPVTNEDGSVTVTVTFDEDVIITNNDGKNTYTFTENGEFTFEFEDKAGNKGSAKAEVTSIQPKEPEVEFKTLETKEEAGKVYVKAGKDSAVDSIKSDIDTDALAGKTVEIENLTEDGKIKTGSTITIDGNVQCIIVVNGDVDGDGTIDFIGDIITANNYRLELIELEVEQKLASDIDGDGKVDFIKDLIKINNYRLGLIDSL